MKTTSELKTFRYMPTASQSLTVYVRYLIGGWGCSSVGTASDRHVADVGSIPRCGKGLFSQSQLSVQTLLQCPHIPGYICTQLDTMLEFGGLRKH